MKSLSHILMSLLVVVLLTCQVCQSETLTVNPNGSGDFTKIQDAINYAYDFDTIVVYPGLYEEHVNYYGRLVTVKSTDPNDPNIVESTVIDGAGSGSVVMFNNAEAEYASLEGFTVQNGATGINCIGADTGPRISKCNVVSNNAGISCNLSWPTISCSTISHNSENGITACHGQILKCVVESNGYNGIMAGNCIVSETIIRANGHSGILNHGGTIINCIISGNMINGIHQQSLALNYFVYNCTIAGNKGSGIYSQYCGDYSRKEMVNNIVVLNWGLGIKHEGSRSTILGHCNIWGNRAGAIYDAHGALAGRVEIISENPFFAKNGFWDQDVVWHEGDYHLRSKTGRWDMRRQDWASDPVDSPCLDRGDPSVSPGDEPLPNGGVINMGAYGGTPEASMSGGPAPICTRYPEMDFNKDCRVDHLDFSIFSEHWLECNLEPESAM